MSTPTHSRPRALPRKVWAILCTLIAFLLIVFVALLLINRANAKSAFLSVASTDYTQAAMGEIKDDISVEATVAARETTEVKTDLTGAVTEINVEAGQAVKEGDVLLKINVDAEQKELDDLKAKRDSAEKQARKDLEAAETALKNHTDGITNGTESGIANARQALEAAYTEYDNSLAAYNAAVANGEDASAASAATSAAAAAVDEAANALDKAEAAAYDKTSTLESARDAAQKAADDTTDKDRDKAIKELQKTIEGAEVKAPHDGVITDLKAQKGEAASGPLLTIADDSKLKLVAYIGESDVDKIKVDDAVEFTAGSTGDKTYDGKVVSISEIVGNATNTTGEAAASGSGSSEPTFPVDIEVTGDTEGLRIGGSADVDILIQDVKNVLLVPIEAVSVGLDGSDVVLKAVTDDSGRTFIEEVSVTTGAQNDFDIAIEDGDLASGEIVLIPGDNYVGQHGTEIQLDPGGLDPELVPEEGTETTTATATSTKTTTKASSTATTSATSADTNSTSTGDAA